jgi:hypothetical protein
VATITVCRRGAPSGEYIHSPPVFHEHHLSLTKTDHADEVGDNLVCFSAAKGLVHLIGPPSVGRRFFHAVSAQGKGYTVEKYPISGLDHWSLNIGKY